MQRHRPTFEVVAHRRDNGTGWELDALDVPGIHVEVVDLADGSRVMRTVLADRLAHSADEFALHIVLT